MTGGISGTWPVVGLCLGSTGNGSFDKDRRLEGRAEYPADENTIRLGSGREAVPDCSRWCVGRVWEVFCEIDWAARGMERSSIREN